MDAKIRINGPLAFWGYDKTERFAQSLLFCKLRRTSVSGTQRSEAPPDIRFWDATFRDYSSSFRGLNVERLLFSPLLGLTVVKRNAVLNATLQGSRLTSLH